MATQTGDWWRYRREAQRAPLLAAEREKELLKAAQAGDRAAVSAIVLSHMRLVVDVASRYARPGLSAHDLIGEGILGLLEALRRFDPIHGARFASYAVWWIRAFVRQYSRANRRIVGAPSTRGSRIVQSELRRAERKLTQALSRTPTCAELAEALAVPESDVAAAHLLAPSSDLSLSQPDGMELPSQLDTPETLLAVSELETRARRALELSLSSLNPRERKVISERLADDGGRRLCDLGHELGVSRQRVGQILGSALEKLRLGITLAERQGHLPAQGLASV